MASLALSTNVCPDSWQFVKEQAEKYLYQEPMSKDVLPPEVRRYIFEFLSLEKWGQISCICKEWKMLTADNSLWESLNLKTLFPKLQILDAKTWKTHVDMATYELDVAADFRQDKQMIKTLKKFASLKIEGDAGITLLTIPKGLTFNKLMRLAQSPKQGRVTRIKDFGDHQIAKNFGNIPIDRTYRVIITNNILEKSRRTPRCHQEGIVELLGCQLPGVLEVATLAILTYISSTKILPTRLYNDNPRTYTNCLEQISSFWVIVGGFTAQGLEISPCCFSNTDTGIGVSQRL